MAEAVVSNIFWIKEKIKNKCLEKNIHGSKSSPHKSCSIWQVQKNLYCHLDVGVCLTDMLWLQGSSLSVISDVSLTCDIPLPQWKRSVNNSWGKQQCKQTLNSAISRIQTASFDHSWFYWQKIIIVSCQGNLCSVSKYPNEHILPLKVKKYGIHQLVYG